MEIKEIFDLITGTATQSILAASLSVPRDNQTNSTYYANDTIDFFMKDGPKIFTSRSINSGLVFIITLQNIFICGYLGYLLGIRMFANPKKINELKIVKLLI